MKKITAVFGSCLFFFVVMTMYLFLDQFSTNLDKDSFLRETEKAAKSVAQIREEVQQLEDGLDFSNRAINTMNEKVNDLINPAKEIVKEKISSLVNEAIKFVPEQNGFSLSEGGHEMCAFTKPTSGHNQKINMLDFFDKIPFDDIDGGVWKQGWNIKYDENDFSDEKLIVIICPHSHNDPGWLKTLDKYFFDQTRHILTNIVDALAKDQKRKFIWAETSYFSMWWAEASPAQKQLTQELLHNGQLEIVTGGWVMNDEANPHYFSMIDQMVEGHQWLKNHLGIKPEYGWAIDPFGYSATMPYILKKMDFKGMLIQRVHYNVKKHLAMDKNLEFMWRQNWDHTNKTDIFTHVMPFYSYDVPHTCGPDPKICCQFDFRRLPGGGIACPWHFPPKIVDSSNVEERSLLLLDQYKKKSRLYRSNVVLAPLGDDFRYEKTFETKHQFENYERIIEYVNSHPELNAELRFGTLKDYFSTVAKREGTTPGESVPNFPTLGGDFFTYADRQDHYWSGYYTSRSFLKHLDRELAAHLRAAEIIYSLAHTYNKLYQTFEGDDMFNNLLIARTELALFQHHDGVTGTAKDHVVVDYGNRMFTAIKDSIAIMQCSIDFLSNKNKQKLDKGVENAVVLDETRDDFGQIPLKKVIILSSEPQAIIFYNSLAQERRQLITVHISDAFVKVVDPNGEQVEHQVNLLWKSERETHKNKFELSFVVVVPPMGFVQYKLIREASKQTDEAFSETQLYHVTKPSDIEHFKVGIGSEVEIKVKNQFFEAVFDSETGMLSDISINGVLHKANLRFMKYGTTNRKEKSGAYLFLPSGSAETILQSSPPIMVTKGRLYTEITTYLQYVTHRIRVYHTNIPEAVGLDIRNTLDIRPTSNFELVMRVETDVKNIDKEFFTDLNGFQMQRRKSLKKLPLQANFYPVPTMIFLQDDKTRVTLQTQQTNGAASLEQGMLEVVLDRRLMQDDNRGVGQGVTDNKVTPSNFRLLFESFTENNKQMEKPPPIAYPSAMSMVLTHYLQHPIFSFIFTPKTPTDHLPYFSGLKKSLPCDLHVLNMKYLQKDIKQEPNNDLAIFLHRVGYDCRLEHKCPEVKVSFDEMFQPLSVNQVAMTSLNLITKKRAFQPSSIIEVPPMEINTYIVNFD